MDRLLDFLLGLSGPGPYFMVFLILLRHESNIDALLEQREKPF
jgi:glycerol-3-phosphate acyltransferase PlsY